MTVESPDDAARRSPLARRRRVLTAFGAATVLMSTLGVLAATQVRSPQQVAADARSPAPSLLTAPVEQKVLSTTLVMRGTLSAGRQYPFTPRSVAASAHGPGASSLVVTAMGTRTGDKVAPGRMLVEVSERPVYALRGAFPAYRDMLPGQTGKDVAQLQAGLRQLGYRNGDREGYFGAGTKAAVRRFYDDLRYPVPLTGPVVAAEGAGAQAKAGPTEAGPTKAAEAGAVRSGSGRTAGVAAPAPEPMVPMSEVAFLPTLPARVAGVSSRVGDVISGEAPLITFATGGLSLTAKLDPADEPLVEIGMRAEIVAEAAGFTGSGTVDSIGAKATSGDSTHLPLRISRPGGWPSDLAGEDVRVTLTTASTDKKVLAVPEAAISSAADGRTSVTVVADDRALRVVEIRVGVSADGLVEVTPVHDGLRPGDEVVTGAAEAGLVDAGG